MDFKVLSASQVIVSQKQINTAALLCQQGFNLIHEAKAEDFKNKQTLKNAAAIFFQAHRQHKQDPHPFIGIGYIATLTGDIEGGRYYFEEALKLSPHHDHARTLLALLDVHETEIRYKLKAVQLQLQNKEASQLENRYSALETEIKNHLQALMQKKMPEPAADLRMKEIMTPILQYHDTLLKQLHQKIDQLDQKVEVQPLRQLIQPLEVSFRRAKKVYTISKQLFIIQKELQTQAQNIKQGLIRIQSPQDKTPLKIHEQKCEAFTDALDKIAAQLEDCHERGIDPVDIEVFYHQTLAMLENYADSIDEKLDSNKW